MFRKACPQALHQEDEAAENNHLAHAAAERHDPAPPLPRHVFPRKELDVRPSEEKCKARYDEQDSQEDIDVLDNR